VGFGATLGLPVGSDKDFYNLVWGLDLQGEFPVAPTFGILLDGGYMSYVGKSGVGNWGLVPILAGGKYYFSDKFFGSLQAGLSFATSSGGGSAFTWTPAIGIKLTDRIDVSLRYQSATKNGWDDSFLGLRLGISL
jgi:hypothetical protein